jgi:lipopolysaccharide export system permease protein
MVLSTQGAADAPGRTLNKERDADVMTIIRRYIFTEFLRFFLVAFVGILAVFLCVEFLQKADDFIRFKADIRDVLAYFWYVVPDIVTPTLPIAALLATLLSLGNLSRHNEIIAMYSGGISLTGIIAPVVVAGVLLSTIGFINNELIMPPAAIRANMIRNDRIEKKRHIVIFRQRDLWLRGPDNSIVNIDFTPPDRSEMIGINIYRMNADFTVRERIRARRLVLEDGAWRLREGMKVVLQGDGVVSTPVDGEIYNIVESPDDLKMIVKRSEEMSFGELWDYVRRLKTSGYYIARYEVDLHNKLAFPLSSAVMVMIATPLALIRVRSGGSGRNIAVAVLIAFAYWSVMSIGMTFGRSGVLPPLVSAWLANILFISATVFILYRMQAKR